jgi:hypothetical protein
VVNSSTKTRFALLVVALLGLAVFVGLSIMLKSEKEPDISAPTDSISQDIPEDVALHIEEKSDLIKVSAPLPTSVISSPLKLKGEARGTWYFEATFPIVIVDWDGRIIGEGYVSALSDWMTEEFVPFEGVVEFEKPEIIGEFAKRGGIIFQKSNPSGLPENDDALEIPVFFE